MLCCMKLFAPIQIIQVDETSFKGTTPLLPDISFSESSRMAVAKKLHRSISSALQSSKSAKLVDMIHEHHDKDSFDYVQVDLFATREHFVLCSLWFVIILVLFTVFYTVASFGYYSFHPQGLDSIEGDILKIVENELLLVSFAKAVVFLIAWNIFYYQVYPAFLVFFGSILIESPAFYRFYSAWMLFPLGLWARKTTKEADKDVQ